MSLAHRFFDEFDAAFITFDGDVIARRYAEPHLACRADGSSETFHDCATIGRYFDRIVKGYYQIGVRSCTNRDVEITDVGERHTLATVTWELRDDAGAAVISWHESYLLVERREGPDRSGTAPSGQAPPLQNVQDALQGARVDEANRAGRSIRCGADRQPSTYGACTVVMCGKLLT